MKEVQKKCSAFNIVNSQCLAFDEKFPGMSYNEQKDQSIETDPEMAQMTERADKSTPTAVRKTPHVLKEGAERSSL